MDYINIDQYQDEFPVVEPGEYLATITKVEDYFGQTGNQTLLIQFNLNVGGAVRTYLGVYAPEDDKKRKALIRFANIARACGFTGQILPTQIIGRQLMIEVTKGTDNNGRVRNDVGFNFKPAPNQMPVAKPPVEEFIPSESDLNPPTSGAMPWD